MLFLDSSHLFLVDHDIQLFFDSYLHPSIAVDVVHLVLDGINAYHQITVRIERTVRSGKELVITTAGDFRYHAESLHRIQAAQSLDDSEFFLFFSVSRFSKYLSSSSLYASSALRSSFSAYKSGKDGIGFMTVIAVFLGRPRGIASGSPARNL